MFLNNIRSFFSKDKLVETGKGEILIRDPYNQLTIYDCMIIKRDELKKGDISPGTFYLILVNEVIYIPTLKMSVEKINDLLIDKKIKLSKEYKNSNGEIVKSQFQVI